MSSYNLYTEFDPVSLIRYTSRNGDRVTIALVLGIPGSFSPKYHWLKRTVVLSSTDVLWTPLLYSEPNVVDSGLGPTEN